MSYVLRHRPDSIGLELDECGWVEVDALLSAMSQSGPGLSREELEEVVRTNRKKRFAFSEDGLMIRANQGHSLDVDLELQSVRPPRLLYHGTIERVLDSIRRQGLCKRDRQYVHLSSDEETAKDVGCRRGRPVVLAVEAWRMHDDQREFFLSANGVWLTDHVPASYIRFPRERSEAER